VAVNLSVSRIHTRPVPLGLVVVRDVSTLRRAREALEQFFRHSPALFTVLGPDGRIRATNPAWERSLGYAPDDLLGLAPVDLIHPDDRPLAAFSVADHPPEGAGAVVFEARFRRKDGGHAWLSWCAGSIGGVTYAVAIVVDERKEAEALLRAKEAAEMASQAKGRLLASVSHELRTPLAAMLGLLDVLLECPPTADDPPITEDLRAIRRSGTHLARLIDDLLDMAQVEAGRLGVNIAPCRPAEVIADVVDLLRANAGAKGLLLTSEYDANAPDQVRTDAMRLRQILFNLVGNAIKYTGRGSVSVRGEAVPRGPAGPLLRVDVIDTGQGLSPEAIDHLFQPFHRGDAGPGGAGLGLAISRKLAELLGGTLAVQSEPGRGSTFSLIIPTNSSAGRPRAAAEPPRTDAEEPTPPPPRFPCRVLLAEDHLDNRRAFSLRLGLAGLDVTTAGDGGQAIEMALAARDEGRPFDVILMDMHMPVVDGFEATSRLRAAGYPGAIFALTADARIEDRGDCLRCGCDEHVSKPVDWGQLLTMIAAHVPADRCD
jgi:PAS domain S-box-containing protein